MAADITDLQPGFQQSLQALINASNGQIYVQSGFRSVEQQTQLFNAAVDHYGSPEAASKWVAPPGHSNHNKGLAADLGGDIELAHKLAPQFGLTFPMSWEPWHIEPVGARENASPQAYTNGPQGTMNPTQDVGLGSTPENLLANLTAALRGIGNGQVPNITPAQQQQISAGVSAGASKMSFAGTGGGVDPKELYQMLKAQGLDSAHAAALVAIAGRESSYKPTAHNDNASTGDNSYGLFQINLLNGMHSQYSPEMLSTAEGSVQAGADLVKASGLQPWGGYKGVSWSQGTDLQAAVDASGGEVTLQELEGLH